MSPAGGLRARPKLNGWGTGAIDTRRGSTAGPLVTCCTLLGCLALTGCGRSRILSTPGQAAFETSLAVDGDRAVAAWHGAPAGEASTLWAQPLDGQATPAGPPLQLTEGKADAFEPDMQLLNGEWVVAWYEKDRVGALRAWLGKFSVAGEVRWRLALSRSGVDGRNPVVRIHDGALHVAWIQLSAADEVSIWTAHVDAQGKYLQPPSQRAMAGAATWNLNAAVDDAGVFHVVYDSHAGTRARELRLLSVGPRNATGSLLTADDGYDSTYPDLAFSGDRAALTWFDLRDGNAEIYLFAGSAGALQAPVGRDARRITTRPRVHGAYLAWNGDGCGWPGAMIAVVSTRSTAAFR